MSRRGTALPGTLVLIAALGGLLYALVRASVLEPRDLGRELACLQSRLLAEAGAERALNFLAQCSARGLGADPLASLNQLFADGDRCTPFVAEPLGSGDTRVGAYSVTLSVLERTPTSLSIAIDASGYAPDAPQTLPPGAAPSAWYALRRSVRYSLAPSRAFDFAWFVDNRGWLCADTLRCRGNAGSNGALDAAGHAPTVTGQPRYAAVAWDGSRAALSGYEDDNRDGARDGGDGGLWSGGEILGARELQGNGGLAGNQHAFQPTLALPQLGDLALAEARAVQWQASVAIDGTQVCDAVLGDEPGEPKNLFLVGTPAHPIVLNGPVVVRGDVLISGCVTGQGALYAGGNVYCPKSIRYKNPPAAPRPANGSQAATEAWLTANWNRDFLGLFARENIVVGDFTDATWQQYVALRMSDPLNVSAEDAGSDRIPGTRAGRDGIPGTADDDALEGDGQFSLQHYSQRDVRLGLVPRGAHVGDAIPGTGEDLDGDGLPDATATLASVLLATALDRQHWAGNLPAQGSASYHSLASMRIDNLDAVFCAGHAFCWTVLGSQDARINGALVCRNDDSACGAPQLEINYDCRLLGGSTSRAARFLPLTLQAAVAPRCTPLDTDPNREVPLP
jgi:hypothetical protein